MTDKRRYFNRKEKIALYLMADGKCEDCGKPLEKGWHADHIHPHSKGGLTDIVNAQALCDICNQKKGAKMPNFAKLRPWPSHLKLRDWQEIALTEWETRTAPTHNFLLVATPGAGKTLFSLKLVHQLFESNRIDFVVIVCPTTHLKTQWAKKAHEVGIDIDPVWTNINGTFSNEYLGIAITYQGVASDLNTTILRRLCSMKKTLVIFDEIHHAGEGKTWGDSINTAFDPAKHRLLLSGTPFRSDNHRIPYVSYDSNYSYADYRYEYYDALRDGVCRPVFFPSYEGDMEWISKDGKHVSASFADELDEEYQASERLRTALDPKGDWIREVIKEAHQSLQQMRSEEHKNAGGLILAIDQQHAKSIANIVRQVTGEEPSIAISESPDASKTISTFENSSRYWIIAVKMVSEGVDLPRLRVLVYATNVATELFFRQAVGRVIRVIPDIEEQSASLYMPAEELLLKYAKDIKEERDHIIEEEFEIDDIKNVEEKIREEIESFYSPISSEAKRDNVIFDQIEFSPEQLDQASELARNMGFGNLPTPLIARIMHAVGALTTEPKKDFDGNNEKPLYERKKSLRTKVSTLVRKYAFMTGIPFNEIHTEWLKLGGSPQGKASEEELMKKKAWILKKIETYGKQKGQ